MSDSKPGDSLLQIGRNAKKASQLIGNASTESKNNALKKIAQLLQSEKDSVVDSNALDIHRAQQARLSTATIDRLSITSHVLASVISGVIQLIHQPDPVGIILDQWELQPNLKSRKISVPIGVVGMIYEGRPNVTVDAACLAIKTGNAIVLRGSSSAIDSNRALVRLIRLALKEESLPENAVQLIEDTSREGVLHFLKMKEYIDVVLPRGGKELIDFVIDNATIPVIETGAGVCHLYIDKDANIAMAKNILLNAKTQRPSVCNAIETLLIHQEVSSTDIREIINLLFDHSVTCYGCDQTQHLDPRILTAGKTTWATEHQNLTLGIKIVSKLEEALDHIAQFGTKHSESIITSNEDTASRFQTEVDAAVVYHNASTRFTDGYQFGFGAELGISTQKLHARGPMGLTALTSYKYIVTGNGHCRTS